MVACFSERRNFAERHAQFRDEYRCVEVWHRCFVEVFPDSGIDKEQLRLAMSDQVVHSVSLKFVKDRHSDNSRCQASDKGNSPIRRVFTTNCNFVAGFDSGCIKQDMQLFYDFCHIFVLVVDASHVGEGKSVPIFLYSILDIEID